MNKMMIKSLHLKNKIDILTLDPIYKTPPLWNPHTNPSWPL